MNSKGYTGQIRCPIRYKTFSLKELNKERKTIEEIILSDFSNLKTAFEVTQYLRGNLLILIDFLMTNEYKNPLIEIREVIELFKQVVILIAHWLHLFPSIYQYVLFFFILKYSFLKIKMIQNDF